MTEAEVVYWIGRRGWPKTEEFARALVEYVAEHPIEPDDGA